MGAPARQVNLASLARTHTTSAIRTLATIMAHKGAKHSDRIAAAAILLDRGWGKPATTHTGAGGEGGIKVIVRHIVGGVEQHGPERTITIDHKPEPGE